MLRRLPRRWRRAALAFRRQALPEMDRLIHAERLDGRAKRRHRRPIDDLPDGAFVTLPKEPEVAFAVLGGDLLRWTPAGYASRQRRPAGIAVDVLTPPSTSRRCRPAIVRSGTQAAGK